MFVGANYAAANMNKQQTYLNGVGWPLVWSNGSVVARGFDNNVDYCIYVAFDGTQTYSTGDVGGGPLATKTSSALCNGNNLSYNSAWKQSRRQLAVLRINQLERIIHDI